VLPSSAGSQEASVVAPNRSPSAFQKTKDSTSPVATAGPPQHDEAIGRTYIGAVHNTLDLSGSNSRIPEQKDDIRSVPAATTSADDFVARTAVDRKVSLVSAKDTTFGSSHSLSNNAPMPATLPSPTSVLNAAAEVASRRAANSEAYAQQWATEWNDCTTKEEKALRMAFMEKEREASSLAKAMRQVEQQYLRETDALRGELDAERAARKIVFLCMSCFLS